MSDIPAGLRVTLALAAAGIIATDSAIRNARMMRTCFMNLA